MLIWVSSWYMYADTTDIYTGVINHINKAAKWNLLIVLFAAVLFLLWHVNICSLREKKTPFVCFKSCSSRDLCTPATSSARCQMRKTAVSMQINDIHQLSFNIIYFTYIIHFLSIWSDFFLQLLPFHFGLIFFVLFIYIILSPLILVNFFGEFHHPSKPSQLLF